MKKNKKFLRELASRIKSDLGDSNSAPQSSIFIKKTSDVSLDTLVKLKKALNTVSLAAIVADPKLYGAYVLLATLLDGLIDDKKQNKDEVYLPPGF